MKNNYQTERLIISKCETTDIDGLTTMLDDQELVMKTGLQLPINREERVLALSMLVNASSLVVYVLRNKVNTNLIGLVIFSRIYLDNYQYSDQACEVGFGLKRGSRQQGIMIEVLNQLLPAYFEETNFTLLYAGVRVDNLPSKKLLTRMKFEHDEIPKYLNHDQFDHELEYFCLQQ